MTNLCVVLEGGFVQAVISNDPRLIGKKVVVVDYDTDGAEAGDLTEVAQSDGTIIEAFVHHLCVSKSEIGSL